MFQILYTSKTKQDIEKLKTQLRLELLFTPLMNCFLPHFFVIVWAGENIDIGIDIEKKVKYRENIVSKEKAGITHPYQGVLLVFASCVGSVAHAWKWRITWKPRDRAKNRSFTSLQIFNLWTDIGSDIFATLKRCHNLERKIFYSISIGYCINCNYAHLYIFIVDFFCIINLSALVYVKIKYKNQVCVRGEPSKNEVALRVRECETRLVWKCCSVAFTIGSTIFFVAVAL